mmetsp:Transcript_55791/g.121533  ORF Transcript_55791/g.121533 Transcript_55791/m.121533 type:complete len:188 (-) Transcript_55791:490-1053(-)|eukprot:CAMPEP_0116916756 /NCGR_PEP_ID=MMETSP0467-20121206/18729_1 /TAXON_ID=283647 /ORGANISM="Mesodinium pulex, Strain SPMC105" /LENGTH=187 /DNA_ID=CAMNT_0004593703 /DNA_START=396 /DNA_END=959 /DNA_ORIENTATION=+
MTSDDQGDMNNVNMDDINEIFKNFGFGFNKRDMEDVFGGFGDFFSQDFGMHNQVSRGKDIQTALNISFEEAIRGVTKVVHLNKPDVCSTCSGSRMKPGTSKSTCSSCRGTGRLTFQQGPMIMQQTCSTCGGQGEKIAHPCNTCRGTGRGTSTSKVEIKVPAGINEGQTLRMAGKGYSGMNGGQSGDL